ncbi:hypothetical protein LNKW23_05490 [Paralimibaculum aggregatum]|uniref:DUF1127 domain-containing protein n=1 Tax=Paralimibaculum aggregatum TaxID=3036245 RepID=A0ABQ6LLN8_9RHOB|nr:hypothetical protein [Limibaculum sp. NKW23]GMG81336.1 hypothetical protein LNKW23_05490 [Limibaculum sp. NKW23]
MTIKSTITGSMFHQAPAVGGQGDGRSIPLRVWQGVLAALSGIGRIFVAMSAIPQVNRAMREYEWLSRMSDEQLEKRGYRRETLIEDVVLRNLPPI